MSEVSIDWSRCRGHGVCSAALGEMVTLDDWGFPVLSSSEVPKGLEGAAHMAQVTCPAAALRLKS